MVVDLEGVVVAVEGVVTFMQGKSMVRMRKVREKEILNASIYKGEKREKLKYGPCDC